MIHTSIAIVAHPDRKAHVEELEDQVSPSAVLWDDCHLGAEKNHLRAWEWLSGEPTEWSVVLEDDAQPCKDFAQQLRAALRVAPSPVVGLYLGRGRPLTVDGFDWPNRIAAKIAQDVCWLTAPGMANCVGVAIRTDLLGMMLCTVPLLIKDRPIDQAIGNWAHNFARVDVAYTRPSIVDHRDGPTTIPNDLRVDGRTDNGMRKAWLFGTRVSWDKSVLPL